MKLVLDSVTQANIDRWLQGSFDEKSKEEIRRLQKENPKELQDAFYKDLEFGTGGLRGLMGVGTNRLNIYTIQIATEGLARYVCTKAKHPSVLVGYDSRNQSRQFAEQTAKVLSAHGIKVFIYKELRPIALISFGVRYLHCTAAVMITASHNPAEYNGYKVYWSDGGQVLPPHDEGIIAEVRKVKEVKKGENLSLISEVNGEIDAAYLHTIHALQLHPGDNHTRGKELSLVYTPLYGTGITILPKALQSWGFHNFSLVEEQATPDGNFPTAPYPNPEELAALKIGREKLKEQKADLLIATDPDADRIGVVCNHRGEQVVFNGNEMAALLAEHVCRGRTAAHEMPPKPMFIKTIVTTELVAAIAKKHKVDCIDVLTGFKYIGQKITEWERESAPHHYLFGGEESYGYLYGTHARDKDAIISALLIAEMALQLKKEGKTLLDFLYEIYENYGVYREKLHSLTFEGKQGAEQIAKMMQKLRKSPPQNIGPHPVEKMEDYHTREVTTVSTGHTSPLHLPPSDVLRFWLEGGTKIVVRPSGTEPKIKLYCAVFDPHHSNLPDVISRCDKRLEELLTHLEALLKG